MKNIEWTERTWNPLTGCKNGCIWIAARLAAVAAVNAKHYACSISWGDPEEFLAGGTTI
jgi:protein gp37